MDLADYGPVWDSQAEATNNALKLNQALWDAQVAGTSLRIGRRLIVSGEIRSYQNTLVHGDWMEGSEVVNLDSPWIVGPSLGSGTAVNTSHFGFRDIGLTRVGPNPTDVLSMISNDRFVARCVLENVWVCYETGTGIAEYGGFMKDFRSVYVRKRQSGGPRMNGPAIMLGRAQSDRENGCNGIIWNGGEIQGATDVGLIDGGSRLELNLTIEGNDRGLRLEHYAKLIKLSVHWEANGEYDLKIGYGHQWGPVMVHLLNNRFSEGGTGKDYAILVRRCLGLRIEGADVSGYRRALVHREPTDFAWSKLHDDPDEVITGSWRDVLMSDNLPVCDNPSTYFDSAYGAPPALVADGSTESSSLGGGGGAGSGGGGGGVLGAAAMFALAALGLFWRR